MGCRLHLRGLCRDCSSSLLVSRAENRHQANRAKSKARELSGIMLPRPARGPACTAEKEKWVRRMFKNRKPCSCSRCCNFRRNAWNKKQGKLTMQERRAQLG